MVCALIGSEQRTTKAGHGDEASGSEWMEFDMVACNVAKDTLASCLT